MKRTIASIVIVLGLLGVAIAAAGGVSADPGPEPYNNTTATADQDEWVGEKDGDSIDGIAGMIARAPSYLITGSAGSAYGTFAGLLLGLIGVTAVGFNRGGMVAGTVTFVAGTYVFTEVGLAEPWAYAVMLMVSGVLVFVVYGRLRR